MHTGMVLNKDQCPIIFLMGLMGSGKTTLGQNLAKLLDYQFVDLDEAISLKTGMKVTDYFQDHGEESFRKLEAETLQTLLHNWQNTTPRASLVCATGGGTPCYFDNMALMNTHGRTIYLSVPLPTLVQRLRQDPSSRPLIKDKAPKQLLQFLRQQRVRRQAFYQKAKLIVRDQELTAEKLIYYLTRNQP